MDNGIFKKVIFMTGLINKTNNILEKAQIIWDYHLLHMDLHPSDLIIVLGSNDIRVAQRGAELFLNNYAPLILFSGGIAHTEDMLNTGWNKPEADVFAEEAIKLGVPKEDILIENKATNTGENILMVYELLKKKTLIPNSVLIVQKPYMERRTYATFKKQWSERKTEILITSPQIDFLDYPNEDISMEEVINIMVGDLQRIVEYPKKGFQIYQEVPDEVLKAYKFLVNKGYNKHLI